MSIVSTFLETTKEETENFSYRELTQLSDITDEVQQSVDGREQELNDYNRLLTQTRKKAKILSK